MRTLLVVTPFALIACMKVNPDYCPAHPEDHEHCGGMVDAAIDVPDIDGPNNTPICYGADNYEACLPFTPTDPVTLNGTIDTTAGTMCLMTQPVGWTNRQPAACFIVGKAITISNVIVSGNRPLVILGDTITVNGLLDAAAHETMPTKVAPGAPYTNCMPFGDLPTNNTNGSGGGAGGSFMTGGGLGGAGNNGQAGNHGGIAANADPSPPGSLRGGCAGQKGGDSNNTGGSGGGAGGAVYLAASNTLTISSTGIINVSGAGGGSSSQFAGGGGGGTGGMIVLYANTISASSGKLLANGGGGASGSANGAGTAGQDPSPATPLVQASSVTGPQNCCTGNVGYAGGMDAGAGGNGISGQSGGGGGGGGGYIKSNKALGGQVSPPAVM